jgi:hypothetical protein
MKTNLKSSEELVQVSPTMETNLIGADQENLHEANVANPFRKPKSLNLKPLFMKKIIALVVLFTIFSSGSMLRAQGFDNSLTRFSNTTDYINVNVNNFVVTNAGSDLDNYHYSTLRLGIELAELTNGFPNGDPGFNTGATPHDVLGKFTAYRVEYTEPIQFVDAQGLTLAQTRLRCLVVRANSNTDLNAPCIMLATGSTGRIEDFGSGLIINYTDLLMRGYVVCFYETMHSTREIPILNIFNLPLGVIANLVNDRYPGTIANNPDIVLQQFYLTGEAAVKLVSAPSNAAILKIDPNKVFTLGFSAGSLYSQELNYGNRTDFPVSYDSLSGIFPRNDYTVNIPEIDTTVISIRGAVALGGTYFKHNSLITNLIDVNDSNKRSLHIFGKDDTSPAGPYLGNSTYESHTDLSQRLTDAGIKHYINPICDASHLLYSNADSIVDLINSINFKAFRAVLYNTAVNDVLSLTSNNPSYLQEYNSFKKINSQVFQVGNTAAKFFQNTLSNTPTVMGVNSNIEHIKCSTTLDSYASYQSPFVSDTNWQFNTVDSNCEAIVGIDEIMGNTTNVKVFPNPSNNFVTFSIENGTVSMDTNEHPELVLYDQMGREVYRGTFQETTTQIVHVHNFRSGLYLYRIAQNGQLMGTGEIIIE